MAPGDLDGFDDRDPFDGLEVTDLVGEPFIALCQHRHFVYRRHLYCLSSKLHLAACRERLPDPSSIVKDHDLEAE
jgi:hypothetical protein